MSCVLLGSEGEFSDADVDADKTPNALQTIAVIVMSARKEADKLYKYVAHNNNTNIAVMSYSHVQIVAELYFFHVPSNFFYSSISM